MANYLKTAYNGFENKVSQSVSRKENIVTTS